MNPTSTICKHCDLGKLSDLTSLSFRLSAIKCDSSLHHRTVVKIKFSNGYKGLLTVASTEEAMTAHCYYAECSFIDAYSSVPPQSAALIQGYLTANWRRCQGTLAPCGSTCPQSSFFCLSGVLTFLSFRQKPFPCSP